MTLSIPESAALSSSSDDDLDATARAESQSHRWRATGISLLLLGILLVASIFAYKDVLFNWFSGDDFVHLCWLQKTLTQPELVLRNFYANWLDAFGSAFYRPLVSVSLYFDYLIWRDNGLGFHITNLAFHFTSVVALFLFVQEIQSAAAKKVDPSLLSSQASDTPASEAGSYLWPFFAAGLFALHPIHPEVVSWIIGRVDSVATAFVMICLYCYARWRRTNSRLTFACGLASMSLALCSKEIAVLLPPVLTMYEVCFGPTNSSSSTTDGAKVGANVSVQAIVAKIKSFKSIKSLKPLVAFWLCLVGYFGVRQLALGTWLGGYDNTLGLGVPLSVWLAETWHGFLITLVPVNADVISPSNALIRIWTYGSAVCGVVLFAFLVTRQYIREMIFTAGFAVLTLLPVYKIFFVLNSNLEASRYAYLLTVPLCMMLGLAIAHVPLPRKINANVSLFIRTAFGITVLVAAFGLLRVNNGPWHEAGVTANAVQAGLQQILGKSRAKVPKHVVLVGPPDAYKGAYICRNAIDFMTEHLAFDPDRSAGVITILDKQKVFPMATIREAVEKAPSTIEIWHWDSPAKKFVHVQPIVETLKAVDAGLYSRLFLRFLPLRQGLKR